jgi:hypothetical protein
LAGQFLAGQTLAGHIFSHTNNVVEYVSNNVAPITSDEALYLVSTSLSPYNTGVPPRRRRIYDLPPRPRPPRPRPRSIAIARMYSEFLPSRRVLPSSLAGAVLAGISVGSGGVE